MRERTGISKQGEQSIQDFIHALTIHEDLNPQDAKGICKRHETFYQLV